MSASTEEALEVTGQPATISDQQRTPPNHATRGTRGHYYLDHIAIYNDPKDHLWKYSKDHSLVPTSEFWIPQRANRPPNNTFYHRFNDKYYLLGFEVEFDKNTKHWGGYNPGPESELTYEFVPDDFFKGPKWIEGNPDNLPESLQHRSAVSTPKAAVKTTPKGKTFGVTQESESGTESSDENPDQQFESSSDLSESEDKTVPDLLSPIDFNPFEIEQEKPNSPGLQYIEVDPKPDPSPGPPVPPKPPTPPPEPPIATMTTPAIQPIPSLLGEIPTFTGKRSQAQDFIDRMELFLDLNPGCINTDRLKIGLTLSMITDKAENWRRNQNNNLNDAAKTEITWNDWTGFKTRFLNNWQEIDSPGNAYTELVQLQKRKDKKGKRISIPKYVGLFKECHEP
ncbi:hypothetical protein F5887DRAFT_1076286 [Amanita rubescens]|nr:hypothetical protein F5887DRAFT_1076286 [Amanita rubescens]